MLIAMEDVPQPGPDHTIIRIAGIDKEIRMPHITDSHLTETDAREEDRVTAAASSLILSKNKRSPVCLACVFPYTAFAALTEVEGA